MNGVNDLAMYVLQMVKRLCVHIRVLYPIKDEFGADYNVLEHVCNGWHIASSKNGDIQIKALESLMSFPAEVVTLV